MHCSPAVIMTSKPIQSFWDTLILQTKFTIKINNFRFDWTDMLTQTHETVCQHRVLTLVVAEFLEVPLQWWRGLIICEGAGGVLTCCTCLRTSLVFDHESQTLLVTRTTTPSMRPQIGPRAAKMPRLESKLKLISTCTNPLTHCDVCSKPYRSIWPHITHSH